MRCYLDGYRNDRICDICNELNQQRHDRCKIDTKVHRNSNLLLKCSYCITEIKSESGTDEYGRDDSYNVTYYNCSRTNSKCNPTEDCLDTFLEILGN